MVEVCLLKSCNPIVEQHLGSDIIVPILLYSPWMIEVYLATKNINNITKKGASLARCAFNWATITTMNAKVYSLLQAKNSYSAIALKRECQLA